MSDSHEIVFSSLAILFAKHQGLDLTDEQMFLLLNIESSLPAALAEAVKRPLIVAPAELEKLLKLRLRASLEAADGDIGANGEFLKMLLAFIEKILPLILPLFVKKAK